MSLLLLAIIVSGSVFILGSIIALLSNSLTPFYVGLLTTLMIILGWSLWYFVDSITGFLYVM